jgi:hypothetical protein
MYHQGAGGVVVAEVGGQARCFQHHLDFLDLDWPVRVQVAEGPAGADGFLQFHVCLLGGLFRAGWRP